MKRMSPYTFVFSDGGSETFERTFYDYTSAKAQSLAKSWASSQGFKFEHEAALSAAKS